MEELINFGLSQRICDDLTHVFAQYSEIEQVLIFGSRAKGYARSGSDIDLAVFAPQLSNQAFAELWNTIDELPLIFKIDLLHWDRLANLSLKEKILHEGCLFYAPSNAPS